MRLPCIHEAETINRRDAFHSTVDSLESTNHRENGRPPLRPDVANKTPLHELTKCPSMKTVGTSRSAECTHSAERSDITRSCFLFVVTLETGMGQKGAPPVSIYFCFRAFSLPLSSGAPLYDERSLFRISKTASALFRRCSSGWSRLLIFPFCCAQSKSPYRLYNLCCTRALSEIGFLFVQAHSLLEVSEPCVFRGTRFGQIKIFVKYLKIKFKLKM